MECYHHAVGHFGVLMLNTSSESIIHPYPFPVLVMVPPPYHCPHPDPSSPSSLGCVGRPLHGHPSLPAVALPPPLGSGPALAPVTQALLLLRFPDEAVLPHSSSPCAGNMPLLNLEKLQYLQMLPCPALWVLQSRLKRLVW